MSEKTTLLNENGQTGRKKLASHQIVFYGWKNPQKANVVAVVVWVGWCKGEINTEVVEHSDGENMMRQNLIFSLSRSSSYLTSLFFQLSFSLVFFFAFLF